jgi:hypothetical protein
VSSPDGRLPTWNVATPLLTLQNLSFVQGFTSDVANTSSTAKGGARFFKMADRSP